MSRSARSRTIIRVVPLVLACAVVAAACGTGESAIDAGRDDVDEVSETDDVAETQATPPATDGETTEGVDDDASTTDSSGDTTPDADGTDAETVPPATEPPSPLADLPACPTDALDDADSSVEITMWFGLADSLADELQMLADDFNSSQDAVVVNIENQVDYESTIDKYLQLDVDQRPEVLLAPEFVVQSFAESESFVPVDACIESSGLDTSSFLPRALNAYGYDDVQWALPFNVSSPVLFYVEPTFVAAGLDPADPPLTLEELRDDSETVVESGAAAYGLVVDVARDSAGGIFEQWFGQAEVPYVNNDNGRSGRATEVLFDDETGLRLFTYLQDLRRDELSFNVGENPGGLDAFLKLVDPSEPGAMTIATSAALTQLLDGLDAGLGGDLTQDDLGVGPMPGPTDEPAAQVSGAALWIPAEKGDEATAAAWSFTAFLIDAQTQSTWAAGTGYVPMRSDSVELDPIATLFETDPRFKVSYDQLAAPIDSPAAARPALGPQREVRQEVVDAISRLYADPDGADAEQLLGDAAETSDTLITNYNDLN